MYYSDFNEKSQSFSCSKQIDSIEQLNSFLSRHKHNRKFFFRGVNEAKYKLYTSAQRKWLIENVKTNCGGTLYSDFVKGLIRRFYHLRESLMKRYFKCIKLRINALNAMCYMQHYGAPTPMLDFTTDIKIALFFMVLDAKSDNSFDIDGYCSLYTIEKRECTNVELFHYDNEQKDFLELNYFDKSKLYYIDFAQASKRNQFSMFTKPNNLNMVAQKGVLLLHNEEEEPIEKKFSINCYNIHKSLIPYIESYLKSKGVTKGKLFPQPEAIAKICTDSIYKNKIK